MYFNWMNTLEFVEWPLGVLQHDEDCSIKSGIAKKEKEKKTPHEL